MTDTKRLLRVFLCHASGDKPAVKELYEHLINDGIDAWYDKEKLIPGQDWKIEISKAVRNSDVVIVCLSSQSITKEGFVQKEIKFSLDVADEKPDGTIFIIPARLEDCEIPEQIRKYHWVDLFSDDGYEKLKKALRIRANNLGFIVKHKKRSTKPIVEDYPSGIYASQNVSENINESYTPSTRERGGIKKIFEFFVEHWLISTIISTSPALWFVFLKTIGGDLGLMKDGILTPVASNILEGSIVISLFFTYQVFFTNKKREREKKSGQILLFSMLENVNMIKEAKLQRFTGYINTYYGKQNSNHFFETIQPRIQMENILESMQIVLSQLSGIGRNNISLSLIYKTDKYPNWQWLSSMNIELDLGLEELTTIPYTTAKQVIDGKSDLIFYPDKKIGVQNNVYFNGKKDLSHGGIGSILCKNIRLDTRKDCIQAVLSVATYGLQLCSSEDFDAIEKITHIILPAFERRIQLELASLYIKEVMSVSKDTKKYFASPR